MCVDSQDLTKSIQKKELVGFAAWADIFTQALTAGTFQKHRAILGARKTIDRAYRKTYFAPRIIVNARSNRLIFIGV